MRKTVIVGGGFTGLIAKLFIPDALIITQFLGDRHFLGRDSIKIFKNEYNELLLQRIGRDCMEQALLVGYEIDGKILDYPSYAFLEKFVVAKMGDLIEQSGNSVGEFKGADPVVYDISSFELFSAIYNNIRVNKPFPIFGSVDKIDNNFVYCGEEKIEYDLLISTIPSPVFWKAYGKEKRRLSLPIVFAKSVVAPAVWSKKYHFVNYTSYDFNRVQAIKGGYLYESLNDMNIAEQYESQKVVYGRFINAPDNIPPSDKIKFVGRFAEWNHKIRIENTVEKILNIEREGY